MATGLFAALVTSGRSTWKVTDMPEIYNIDKEMVVQPNINKYGERKIGPNKNITMKIKLFKTTYGF